AAVMHVIAENEPAFQAERIIALELHRGAEPQIVVGPEALRQTAAGQLVGVAEGDGHDGDGRVADAALSLGARGEQQSHCRNGPTESFHAEAKVMVLIEALLRIPTIIRPTSSGSARTLPSRLACRETGRPPMRFQGP